VAGQQRTARKPERLVNALEDSREPVRCVHAEIDPRSGKVKASRVVAAMGRPDLAPFSLRISGGWASTAADWAACAEAWSDIQARRRARQPQFA